jgi:cytochrome c oxidase subunit 2
VGKFWSLLFFLVPILGVATFAIAPAIKVWLPPDVSANGYAIDHLFMFILWLTGAVFIATELTLAWFMWKYDAKSNRDPVKFTHGSHTLEIVWTIVPAATLLFIAIYQMNAWANEKMRVPDVPVTVEVTAHQFGWKFRYPGPDGILGTPDDLFTHTQLHLPVNEDILIHLKSDDVLHSFFLPNMRVKQDAVPGSTIPVWFRAKEQGRDFDIVCAELCGWGHYKMKGRLVIESRSQYELFLADLQQSQNATQPPGVAARGSGP